MALEVSTVRQEGSVSSVDTTFGNNTDEQDPGW